MIARQLPSQAGEDEKSDTSRSASFGAKKRYDEETSRRPMDDMSMHMQGTNQHIVSENRELAPATEWSLNLCSGYYYVPGGRRLEFRIT
eukprot:1806682-Pyramimonas_sp.AAC.2